MASVRRTLDPRTPPRFEADELAALDALTPDDVERNAAADADNPPLSEAELRLVRSSRLIRSVRQATGLTQSEFASRYKIGLARLRDWEQGRFEPDSVAMAYLKVIARAPDVVAHALGE